jgi:hypothetical protein
MKTVFQNLATQRAQILRSAVRMSLQVVCWELLGSSYGSMHRGSHRRSYPRMGKIELRWRQFPVRFTATVETSELGARTGAYCFDQDESLACPANADEAG